MTHVIYYTRGAKGEGSLLEKIQGSPAVGVMVIYLWRIEFGPSYLAHEAAWVPLGALRNFIPQQAVGKFSACAAALLQHVFIDSSYCSEGMLLDHIDDGSPAYVFAKFHAPLADEAGLKYF